MKRTSIAALTVAVLALAGTQAAVAADHKNNQGKDKGRAQQQLVEVNGTIRALAAPSITVAVKTASRGEGTRAFAAALLNAHSFTFATDTNTAIRRGNAKGFASLVVGDKVQLRARCTATPLTCVATRVNAAAAPAPKPAPLHLGFAITGVVIAPAAPVAGSTLTVVVVRASDGEDNPLLPKTILGKQFPINTDTATAVYSGDLASSFSALVNFPAVTIAGTCTSATPTVCTAKRINVIVPTS
ncbi:MAG: hypothetical protein ACYC3W_10090 [Candidatus Nanopelagicales bacterium]